MPLIIGSNEVSYPRLNSISFWLLLFGMILVILSAILYKGPAIGWTMYTPLSIREPGHSVELLIFGLHLTGISSLIGAINYITTIINNKIMSWYNLPLFVWSIFFTAILLVLSLPFLAIAITLVLFDRNFNTSFFDSLYWW